MQSVPSSQSITVKIIVMVMLIFIDIIINSFVVVSFSTSYLGVYYINFYFLPIQILVTIFIFIMMLVMMWQTFPLKYGLIGMVFKQFKWTFILVIGFIFITGIQRGLKLSEVLAKKENFSELEIWDQGGYVFFYYLRFLLYPIFYGFVINFCLKIIDPSFYRPNRWLK